MVSGLGTISAFGPLTIGADMEIDGATLDVEVGQFFSDKFNVGGTAMLEGDITIDVELLHGFDPTTDVAILKATGGIIDNSQSFSLVGSGASAFRGAAVVGNQLVLIPVPEPSAFIILSLIGLSTARARRRCITSQ